MVKQDKKPAPIAARPGPVALRPGSSEMMTPKEILMMLRQHVWMIVSLTIVGLLVGSGAWYLVRKYAPKYTARTVFRVLPPAERDPMTITSAVVQKDIQYGYRMDLASILKQQSTLQELIDRDKIQATKWFKNLGQIKDIRIREAVKDLRDNFNAVAQRDGEFVSISMTYGDKFEAALIVNEMLNLFLAKQGSTKRQEITERLAKLEERRDRIEQDLAFAEDALDEVRKRWELTDLSEREYQNPIELRLNDLELQQNDLVLEIKQVDATMKTLERLAAGPINEQIEHMIESDPIMISLAQQLVFQKSELAAKLTKFGENHRVVRQIQEFIKETKQRRELRKLEIAEQTRRSNLQNAQDQLIILSQRLEELNKLRDEAQARKKDLDLARIQYEQRTSIKDERKRMLDSIKTQIEKLKIIHDDPQTPKVQFVGFAPIPLDISSPRMTVYLPGGTMLGLMLGIGLTLLIELLNDLVRTPRDVGRHLHIKLLGMIPDVSEDGQT
ncbi:MAG: GumC family protein, partial [Planctomycetota bacterium]